MAYDLHPGYASTRVALTMPMDVKVGVQHHHAHIASCMAENRLEDPVIGVAFDGTGYGLDGKIWGGEFLVGDYARFERRAQLRYVAMPGGDAAVRQPWRMALAYLSDTFGPESRWRDSIRPQHVPEKHLAVVRTMLARGVNATETSSCGRLFDAVASLTGVCHEATYEGQAAMELEAIADEGVEEGYAFDLDTGRDPWQIDVRPMIQEIVHEAGQGISGAGIAAKFHNTVACFAAEVCRRLREREGIRKVCLSGGAFRNVLLLRRLLPRLRAAGFEVFLHAQVPPNDGGLSLGQAVIANALAAKGV